MLKARLAIAVTLVLVILSAHAGQSLPKKPAQKTMTVPETIEFIRPSVVQILVKVQAPPTQIGGAGGMQVPQRPQMAVLGTGFLVNADGYAVTARHVAQAFQSIQAAGTKTLMVGVATPNLDEFKAGGSTVSIRGSFVLVECDVADEDVRHDLALLKLKQNPFKGELGTFMKVGDKSIGYPHRVATLTSGRPHDGEAIAVSGYPFGSPVLVTTSGNLASSWASETVEVQIPGAPPGFRMPDTSDFYLADMHSNPGNSGGPVYTVARGWVIGVCHGAEMAPVVYGDGNRESASIGGRAIFSNSGLAVVIPIRYVIELLKKNDLKWDEAPH